MSANNNTRRAAPAKWSDFDRFLKPEHLAPGKTYNLTIDHLEMVEVHPRPGLVEEKPVLYFTETKKGLILTSTNQDTLHAEYGDNIAACYGQRVTLRAEGVVVAKRQVTTIRLAPAPTTAPTATYTDRWIAAGKHGEPEDYMNEAERVEKGQA